MVIFDDDDDRDVVEYAREAAKKKGWAPKVILDAEKASAEIGFDTRALITSVGAKSFRLSGFSGLTPIEVSDLLFVPRAVVVEDGQAAYETEPQGYHELTLPRDEPRRVLPLVSVWLEKLATR